MSFSLYLRLMEAVRIPARVAGHLDAEPEPRNEDLPTHKPLRVDLVPIIGPAWGPAFQPCEDGSLSRDARSRATRERNAPFRASTSHAASRSLFPEEELCPVSVRLATRSRPSSAAPGCPRRAHSKRSGPRSSRTQPPISCASGSTSRTTRAGATLFSRRWSSHRRAAPASPRQTVIRAGARTAR
jgi:hypothetical protein